MGIKSLRTAENRENKKREESKQICKCNTCPYSTWTGVGFYCPFNTSAKERILK